MAESPRLANLQRAAGLPWTDEGRCVVQEASQPWPLLAERCYHALEHERVRFNDPTRRCAVASAGAAGMGIGLCVLAAPQIVVGAVIVVGVVVVAVAIKEALDAHELSRGGPKVKPAPPARPAPKQPLAKRTPKPQPGGQSLLPPLPPGHTDWDGRPECRPVPVPHRGGNKAHDKCADKVPGNAFPGWDVLINGKQFDAFQAHLRVTWEVKASDVEKYNSFVLRVEIDKQVKEAQRARPGGGLWL